MLIVTLEVVVCATGWGVEPLGGLPAPEDWKEKMKRLYKSSLNQEVHKTHAYTIHLSSSSQWKEISPVRIEQS